MSRPSGICSATLFAFASFTLWMVLWTSKVYEEGREEHADAIAGSLRSSGGMAFLEETDAFFLRRRRGGAAADEEVSPPPCSLIPDGVL